MRLAWYLPITLKEFTALSSADRRDIREAADEWIDELNARQSAPDSHE